MKKILLSIFAGLSIGYTVDAQTLPTNYTQTTIVSGIRYPVAFDWLPDGRYLVTQKGDNAFPAANAFIKIYSAAGASLGNFYDLTSVVDSDFERGLLGIAVDPDFTNNHYVYAYYTYRNTAQTDFRIRIVRFTENANVGTNPTLIFDHQYATSNVYAGNHFGGIIKFRPSEPTKLYVEIGDLAQGQTLANDTSTNYARKRNNPYGKILRINTDGSIPTDNPYYDDGNPATGNDDRIWSYGHRNTFGMCFNPVTDSMYVSENGYNTWDEFNIIHKGANYGWISCEGNYLYGSTTSPCNKPGVVNPIAEWGTPLPAVSGCVYYSGNVMPEFDNHILVVDNDYGRIYDLTMGNAPAYDIVTSKVTFADITTTGGLTDIKQGSNGCLYALKGGYTTTGAIYRICPATLGLTDANKFENALGQNFPNPTSGSTQIEYSIAESSDVTLELFDVTGRKVKSISLAAVSAGEHTVELADLDKYANGNYFYKLELKQNNKVIFSETKRMLLVK